jgi:hypothetical protein
MRFIHIECLKHWLRSRATAVQVNSSVSYYWKALDCELCKEPLTALLRVNGRVFDLREAQRPQSPYLILEELSTEHDYCQHVVSLVGTNPTYFGRSRDNEVKIPDISVSRRHASVKFEHEHFVLEDLHSKFGTLIRMKRGLVVDSTTRAVVQVGRTLITAKVAHVKPACCFRRTSTTAVSPILDQQSDAELTAPQIIEAAPFVEEAVADQELDEEALNEIEEELNRVK